MSSIKTRKRALDILNASEKSGAHSSALLQKASQEKDVHYPLLQRLVKGTLQWKSKLDDELDRELGSRSGKVQGSIRNVLRIAAYQLLFLKRVPKDIVFDETLRLAQTFGKNLPGNEITRVLSALKPGAQHRATPNAKLENAAAIAREFSHPEWIVSRWIQQIGRDETIALCKANNRPWPVSIRTNSLKISPHQLEKRLRAEGVKLEQSRFVSDSFCILNLPRDVRLHELESFERGFFQVQDESSSLVGLLVAAQPGEFVVDLCAAPGGKATHLATMMRNKGKVLAIDIHEKKLKLIRDNSRRLGLTIVEPREADASKLKLHHSADRVLLDAPCSGLGVLGRKADVRWAKDEKVIAELCELQAALLNNAATLVRPGGRLVYSTCTVESDENERIVETFLSAHKKFRIVPPPENAPKELFSKEGFLRTWPHRHEIAGGFAAVLERIGE